MARRWQPKYAVFCRKCAWRGKRTRATKHRECPRCGESAVAWTADAKKSSATTDIVTIFDNARAAS